MEQLVDEILEPTPNAVTPFNPVLRAFQKRIPSLCRDALIATLANHPNTGIVFLGRSLYVSGAKLK